MPQKEKDIGIWMRVSTEDQAKGENLDHHESLGTSVMPSLTTGSGLISLLPAGDSPLRPHCLLRH
jgi:hypothetical protein